MMRMGLLPSVAVLTAAALTGCVVDAEGDGAPAVERPSCAEADVRRLVEAACPGPPEFVWTHVYQRPDAGLEMMPPDEPADPSWRLTVEVCLPAGDAWLSTRYPAHIGYDEDGRINRFTYSEETPEGWRRYKIECMSISDKAKTMAVFAAAPGEETEPRGYIAQYHWLIAGDCIEDNICVYVDDCVDNPLCPPEYR